MQILFYNVCRSFQFCGPPMIKLNQLYLLRLEKECFCYIQQRLQVMHLFSLSQWRMASSRWVAFLLIYMPSNMLLCFRNCSGGVNWPFCSNYCKLITLKASPVLTVTIAINLKEWKISCLFLVFLSLKIFEILLPRFQKHIFEPNTPYCNVCSAIRESDSKFSLSSGGYWISGHGILHRKI